jgi:hypothetical protein
MLSALPLCPLMSSDYTTEYITRAVSGKNYYFNILFQSLTKI